MVVLANGAGYPMNHLAYYALAELLGRDPEALPFIRRMRQLKALSGVYQTYRGTMTARIKPAGDLLHYTEVGSYDDARVITLLPDHPDEPENMRFHVLAGGVRTPVTFSRSENDTEMIYGRYLFRKVGELLNG
ncbi:MAG: hypothetical protein Kow0077_27370 [Anaerolineae bacterium]